jgi:hypothetical protein
LIQAAIKPNADKAMPQIGTNQAHKLITPKTNEPIAIILSLLLVGAGEGETG